MKARVSLRWRLILLSWSLALAAALALGIPLHIRARRQLLQQFEKTLESKCDEVITVLESAPPHPALENLFLVETRSRFSPYAYFYQVRDGQGRTMARSANLNLAELPIPDAWKENDPGNTVLLQTMPHPTSGGEGTIRLRTERVEVAVAGGRPAALVLQTAVSLGPFEAAMRLSSWDAILVAAAGLGPAFLLLWFVTTQSLRPVSEMTKKASEITASNLRERLPLAGTADELDELAIVLNNMLDRLGASLRQIEQFSSGAAHQLRTPLTRIRGELDLILRSGVTDPPRDQLEKVQEELERLSRLCGRLLLLARVDRQAVDTSLFDERVDLQGLVDELLEQMAPSAQDSDVRLRRGGTSTARVQGSRPLLVEALLNLLDNAIRATPRGGVVAVSTEANGDRVRVSVEDTGPGVPPEEHERIFEPFYRIPGTTAVPAGDGSGLGLAIVKGIAQAHGGRVELTDAPSGGCVFCLVLPAPPAS